MMFWKNIKKKKFVMFMMVMVLSGCASGAGKSAVADEGKVSDVPFNYVQSRKGQEVSEGKESATVTEIPEIQKDAGAVGENLGLAGAEENHEDTKTSDKDSGFMDDEQTKLDKFDNIPTEQLEPQKASGASGDALKAMEKGKEPSEEGQERVGGERQGKGQEESQTEDKDQAWKSAYLEVIYHLRDYLAPRYDTLSHEDFRADDDPMKIYGFYFGLHDFDEDGILELIAGDDWGLGVFTYENGRAKKIADLCEPDLSAIWCVNGVCFKNNNIRVSCAGSGGCNVVNFGYLDGEYVLGHYNEWTPTDPITINGEEATMEEIEKIYTVDYDKIADEERKDRFRLVNENGTWILKHYDSDEENILDINFDFDSVIW